MSVDQREGVVPMHDNWDIDLGAETDTDGDPPRVWVPGGHSLKISTTLMLTRAVRALFPPLTFPYLHPSHGHPYPQPPHPHPHAQGRRSRGALSRDQLATQWASGWV